jgi:DNA replication protein DnaC
MIGGPSSLTTVNCRPKTGTIDIGDLTPADAILDRSLHNAHRIHLQGDSMRKRAVSSKENPTEPELTHRDRSV